MQPLAMTEMTMCHVLILTSLDHQIEAPQCSLTFRKVRLRIAGSLFQRPDSHGALSVPKSGDGRLDIDRVILGGRWRFVQNCRVFRSDPREI